MIEKSVLFDLFPFFDGNERNDEAAAMRRSTYEHDFLSRITDGSRLTSSIIATRLKVCW